MGFFGSQNQIDWIQAAVSLNRVDTGYLGLIKASYFQRDRTGLCQCFSVSNLVVWPAELQKSG